MNIHRENILIPGEDIRARMVAERDRRNAEKEQILALIDTPAYQRVLSECAGCVLFVEETHNCQHYSTLCSCGGSHNIARGILRHWPCKMQRWENPLDDSLENEIHSQSVIQTGSIR